MRPSESSYKIRLSIPLLFLSRHKAMSFLRSLSTGAPIREAHGISTLLSPCFPASTDSLLVKVQVSYYQPDPSDHSKIMTYVKQTCAKAVKKNKIRARRTSFHRDRGRHFDLDQAKHGRRPGPMHQAVVVVTHVPPLTGDGHSLGERTFTLFATRRVSRSFSTTGQHAWLDSSRRCRHGCGWSQAAQVWTTL